MNIHGNSIAPGQSRPDYTAAVAQAREVKKEAFAARHVFARTIAGNPHSRQCQGKIFREVKNHQQITPKQNRTQKTRTGKVHHGTACGHHHTIHDGQDDTNGTRRELSARLTLLIFLGFSISVDGDFYTVDTGVAHRTARLHAKATFSSVWFKVTLSGFKDCVTVTILCLPKKDAIARIMQSPPHALHPAQDRPPCAGSTSTSSTTPTYT